MVGARRAAAPLLVVFLGLEGHAAAADCLESISEANTKKVFEGLPKAPGPDGCALDEVRTDATRMNIRWSRDGHALEPVLLLPSSCGGSPDLPGKVLSAVVPRSVHDACPAEVEALGTLIAKETFGGLAMLDETVERPRRRQHLPPTDLPGGWRVQQEGEDEIRTLRDDGGQALGALRLFRCNNSPPRRVHTSSGWVAIEAYRPDPDVSERLIRAADDLGPWSGPAEECSPRPRWPLEIAKVAALAALATFVAAAARRARLRVDVRLSHAVPVVIQLLIYAYWSLYWPGVAVHARSMVLQVALAYALEAALSLARYGEWAVGLGPLPIVLSANLFAWFDPPGSILMVVTAIASKTLLRSGGKHLLNPSAAGLSAGGLYLLLRPTAQWDGLFHTENLAPNMVELILLLSFLPLLRFRLSLIPLGASTAMALLPGIAPSLAAPGTILAFALFASDPATTPKTPTGRLMYGLFVGAGVVATSRLLTALGASDDFSKVLPVPLANVLASRFDWLASRARGALDALVLAPRWNVVHLALWVLLVLARFVGSKPRQFEATLHWTYGTPIVARGADDVPRCKDNPAFCRPFAFATEIAAWTSGNLRPNDDGARP